MRNSTVWAAAVLLLLFGLALTSMAQKSPTFDEQGFITRGVGYLRGQNRHMRVGHPLGLNALNAIFVAFDGRIALPVDDPSWAETSFHRPAELFLWEIGNDVARVMFLARLPTIWLGLGLAAVTGRWAWEMTRNRYAGLLALALIALDPNVLAHTRLATTDLGLATGAALAGYTLWRFLRKPWWTTAFIAGAAFGLLQNTKFTALLFVPLFALVILANLRFAIRQSPILRLRSGQVSDPPSPIPNPQSPIPNPQSLILLLVTYAVVAPLTLWAANGFQVGTLADGLPTLPQLAGRTLPLAHYLEQLLDIGGRLQAGTPAFLLGRYSDSGWWYYFPVAFLLKTPLPTLILLCWASWQVGKLASWRVGKSREIRNTQYAIRNTYCVLRIAYSDLIALLVPALGYFAIALTTDVNLGYRHLLPILPFLYVFIAAMLIPPPSLRNTQYAIRNTQYAIRITLAVLTIWLVLNTLFIYPHFLAFFNALGGGPDDGWRALVDSNIDWGQDLGALKKWMDHNGVEHVWLSYFGEARPEYYGISYTGLDSWPPRLMNPQARPFYPHDPAPGVYAISATNIQGVLFENHEQFAWFRRQEPVDKIGYTIFIYEVKPRGERVELALSSVQLDEIAPEDFEQWQTNQVIPRWFDAAQSWLAPAGASRWLALGRTAAVHPAWAPLLSSAYEPVTQNETYTLYRQVTAVTPLPPAALAGFTADQQGQIALLALSGLPETAASGQTVTLISTWRQEDAPRPLKIFIHGVDSGGQLVTQWDGLGAAWEGWREGDLLLQAHLLPIPDRTRLALWAGVYDPDTGQRWPTAGGDDRLFLGEIEAAEDE